MFRREKGIYALVLAVLMILSVLVSDGLGYSLASDTSSIAISVPAGAMVKGSKKTIKVSLKKSQIKKISSSNKKVLAVNSKGKLIAKKAGKSIITVISKDGKKSNITITVFNKNADMVVNKKISGKKRLWHVKKGKIVKKSGFATDGVYWYYCKNGFVNKKKTGVISGKVSGEKALWYVKKGVVDTNYNGIFFNGGYTYKIKDGKVTDKEKGKIDAFINDEFSLKIDETKTVGKNNIKISLLYYYPVTGYVVGSMNVGGKEYQFGIITENNENKVEFEDYNSEYNIQFVKKQGDSYVLKLIKRGKVLSATSISGKATDHYVTKGFEYIESDKLIIFMNKGVRYDGNLLVEFEKQMEIAEKTAGFKRKNKKVSYSAMLDSQDYLMGTDVFHGVDPEQKKLHIYVNDDIHPQCWEAPDTYSCIILNSYELDVNAEYFNSDFLHEYSHSIHLSNGPSFNSILNEGYAAYNEVYSAAALFGKNVDMDYINERYFQYLLPKGDLTADNAEKVFTEGYPDGPELDKNYRYGFLFITYLKETYGKDSFEKLFPEGSIMLEKQIEETGMGDLSGEKTAILLKKTFSDSIFKDFAKWLEDNPDYTFIPFE